MSRLLSDPALDSAPDFTAEAFAQARQLLANAQNPTENKIPAQLSAARTRDNDARKERWALADARVKEKGEQASMPREADAQAKKYPIP